MDLIDTMHRLTEQSLGAYGLADMAVGTVTKTAPLEVTVRESMAPLPEQVLWRTAAVIEKKLPVLRHAHTTRGFRHSHAVSGLSHAHGLPELAHTHDTQEGATGSALGGSRQTQAGLTGDYPTAEALTPDAYTSDEQLMDLCCYEDGKPLPVEDGYMILNRGLAVGDKVLLLRVRRGEQFLILSRIFERGDGA